MMLWCGISVGGCGSSGGSPDRSPADASVHCKEGCASVGGDGGAPLDAAVTDASCLRNCQPQGADADASFGADDASVAKMDSSFAPDDAGSSSDADADADGACEEAAHGDLQCVDGEFVCSDGRTRCGDACRDVFQACGSCALDCRDYVDAAHANGLGVSGEACRSNRCYFVVSRYWYATDTPTESCAQICGRAGMDCTLRTDINAVGTQHHNHLKSPLATCATKASSFWPDPDDPNLSYGLSRVDCGCQSPP